MIRYLLASPDQAFGDRVRTAMGESFDGEVRRVPDQVLLMDASRAVATMAADEGGAPDVVVIGPGLPGDAAFALAQAFDDQQPDVMLVMMLEPTADVLEQALRTGVREVLSPGDPDPDLRKALERAGERAQRRRGQSGTPAAGQAGLGGRIIVTVSPKGGAGKTMVATNLAVGLALREPGKVALVDLDVQFGDVSSALQLVPEHTLAEAADAASGALDSMGLKVLLTSHSSDLYVLCAPSSPAEGEQVTGEQAAAVVSMLAREFAYVVVDTSAGLTEQTLSALEVASDMVLVCSMDVATVRNFRKAVESLDQIGMTHQARHVVLNRADARVGLDTSDIERTVGLPVHVEIPSARAVPLSMNQGVALIQADTRTPVTAKLEELVGRFVEVRSPRHRDGGSGLFGRRKARG